MGTHAHRAPFELAVAIDELVYCLLNFDVAGAKGERREEKIGEGMDRKSEARNNV